jgi:hypothetical protein
MLKNGKVLRGWPEALNSLRGLLPKDGYDAGSQSEVGRLLIGVVPL